LISIYSRQSVIGYRYAVCTGVISGWLTIVGKFVIYYDYDPGFVGMVDSNGTGYSMPSDIFYYDISVGKNDLDELNHVNNVVYLQWVQEAATAHWRTAASQSVQEKYIWVVVRHEVDYKMPALLDDELVAKTWVLDYDGARSNRIVQIIRKSDDRVITEAKTTWVMLRTDNGRPVRITDEIRKIFNL
jgi:acyl-CoA thioester hydrolase